MNTLRSILNSRRSLTMKSVTITGDTEGLKQTPTFLFFEEPIICRVPACINEFHFPIPWHVDEVHWAGLNCAGPRHFKGCYYISRRSCSLFSSFQLEWEDYRPHSLYSSTASYILRFFMLILTGCWILMLFLQGMLKIDVCCYFFRRKCALLIQSRMFMSLYA
jgi:hypothetical protein